MPTIKTALIPTAGIGSRMMPFTKVNNKLMLQVINKPLIHYLVEELIASGITHIIISGRHTDAIKAYFAEDSVLGELTKKYGHRGTQKKFSSVPDIRITIKKQLKPKGWVHEIYACRNIIKDNFIVCFSDVLFLSKEPAAKQVLNKFRKTGLVVYSNARIAMPKKILSEVKKLTFEEGDDTNAASQLIRKLQNDGDMIQFSIDGEMLDAGTPETYLCMVVRMAITEKKSYRTCIQSALEDA